MVQVVGLHGDLGNRNGERLSLPPYINGQCVGSPLRVHRRCLNPMFAVANRIAYDGLRVYGTSLAKRRPESLGSARTAGSTCSQRWRIGPDPANWSGRSARFSGTLTQEEECQEAEAVHGRAVAFALRQGGGRNTRRRGSPQDGRVRGHVLPVEEAARRHRRVRDPAAETARGGGARNRAGLGQDRRPCRP